VYENLKKINDKALKPLTLVSISLLFVVDILYSSIQLIFAIHENNIRVMVNAGKKWIMKHFITNEGQGNEY
jgi:hypothetical protein